MRFESRFLIFFITQFYFKLLFQYYLKNKQTTLKYYYFKKLF